MNVEEIEREAAALPESARKQLVASLLQSLSPPFCDISDEIAAERKRELDSGDIEDISLEQLVSGIDLPPSN